MKIYVCVKHVPDSAATITVTGENTIDERVTFIINPYDEHALTEARRIRDDFEGSEVIAVCLGKESARECLRSAMAMGADRSILIKSEMRHDAIETAGAIKAAIDEDGGADLIFTGREAIDSNGMQTMFRLGALYGCPVMTNVVETDISQNRARVVSEGDKGARLAYELELPCVLAAGKGLNKPRYPTMPDIIKSKKKEIKTAYIENLNIAPSQASMKLVKLIPYTENRHPENIIGDTEGTVEKIIDVLKNRAKVI
ncbi:MAG: electron transfer flavoprotein subunit beta/FixA family protein [Desulfobacteraceae bacterium]